MRMAVHSIGLIIYTTALEALKVFDSPKNGCNKFDIFDPAINLQVYIVKIKSIFIIIRVHYKIHSFPLRSEKVNTTNLRLFKDLQK